MAIFADWANAITDDSGLAIGAVQISVRNPINNALITIFSDAAGTVRANPFVTDATGVVRFFVDISVNSHIRVEAIKTGFDFTVWNSLFNNVRLAHGVPRGADRTVQYRRGDAFAGDIDLTWDETTKRMAVAGIQGGLNIVPLATPAAPTVTVVGIAGTTRYDYRISARSHTGETLASAITSITTGNASLTTTNFNRLHWPAVSGARDYHVWRVHSAGTPATLGVIATVVGTTVDDTGLAGGGQVIPISNSSGFLNVPGGGYIHHGLATFGGEGFADIGMSGLLYDRNELTNAAYRGTVTITTTGLATLPSGQLALNILFNAQFDFVAITGLAAGDSITIRVELPHNVETFGRALWQPFFRTRFSYSSAWTYPRAIRVEVSQNGMDWATAPEWQTTSFNVDSFYGLWMGREATPRLATGAGLWPWRFAQFILSNFTIGTSSNMLWIAQLGIRHISAPSARQFIPQVGAYVKYLDFSVLQGNVGIGMTTPTHPIHHGSGAHLTAAGVWTNVSSRQLKTNFEAVSVLDKLANLPIQRYAYKKFETEKDAEGKEKLGKNNQPIRKWKNKAVHTDKHISPAAEDMHTIFGVGSKDGLAAIDVAGVALQGVKELLARVVELEKRLERRVR